MSTHHETVKLVIAAIALISGAGCMDTQDPATPARTESATPARMGPLSAARQDALQRYDLDADGELDVAERERMASEGKARVQALKARIHARYDRNGNGVLEPDEMHAMQVDRDQLSAFKGAALRRYDADHDGVLDPAERQRMRTERQAFLEDVQRKLLARFDTNRDGKLDPQERAVMDHPLAPGAAPTN